MPNGRLIKGRDWRLDFRAFTCATLLDPLYINALGIVIHDFLTFACRYLQRWIVISGWSLRQNHTA